MEFFKELIVVESERSSQKEITHTINVVNNLYNEWKKVGRRKNAVDYWGHGKLWQRRAGSILAYADQGNSYLLAGREETRRYAPSVSER